MNLTDIQKTRIGAALRSILRAALGRTSSASEIRQRTQAYLRNPTRGLGSSDTPLVSTTLFQASDYIPKSEADLLGGRDGRGISRAWAAVREDLDTVEEGLFESERRISQTQTIGRSIAAKLSEELASLFLSASSLESRNQQLFFGGDGGAGASGRGQSLWNISTDSLIYPQTTGILIDNALGIIPAQGSQIGQNAGAGFSSIKITGCSDPSVLLSSTSRAWAENPFQENNPAWTFSSESNPTIDLKTGPLSALRLEVTEGVTVLSVTSNGTSLPSSQLKASGSLWLIFNQPVTSEKDIEITFQGIKGSDNIQKGSIFSLKAFVFSFDSEASLVWGPVVSSSNNSEAIYTLTLGKTVTAIPSGCSVDWQISTLSADGPWIGIPELDKPLLVSSSGRTTLTLANPQTDLLTSGFFLFPFAAEGSLYGATLTAGEEQSRARAYLYDWNAQGETLHTITATDWETPKGLPSDVACGALSTVFRGEVKQQVFPSDLFLSEGTPLARYRDSNDVDLVYINLKGNDNSWTLTPEYNYRFDFALWTPEGASLPNTPVGIYNPNGSADVLGVSVLITLNDETVYRGNSTFSDFSELSSAPSSYGQTLSDYPSSRLPGSGSLQQFQGTNWPPNAGRMNLSLKAGWNILTVFTSIPAENALLSANLQPWSGIVFGPGLFADATTRRNNTGILSLRGWKDPWIQRDEFDLRHNTPIGVKDTWSWKVNPQSSSTEGVLLNHNPSEAETGSISLDGKISGQKRNHTISFLSSDLVSIENLLPGQDPFSRKVWIRARLTSATPLSGPFVSSFQLGVN